MSIKKQLAKTFIFISLFFFYWESLGEENSFYEFRRLLVKAFSLYNEANYKESLNIYRYLLNFQPQNKDLWHLIYRCYYNLGLLPAAYSAWKCYLKYGGSLPTSCYFPHFNLLDKKRFMLPSGLTIDDEDNLYLIVAGRKELIKMTPFLKIIWRKGGFVDPQSIAYSYYKGCIYLVDTALSKVYLISKKGKVLAEFGKYGTKELGAMLRPKSIGIDKEGYVYITDEGRGGIHKFSPKGKPIAFFISPEITLPLGITIGKHPKSSEVLYISEKKRKEVICLDKDGNFILKFSNFGQPYFLSYDKKRELLYVADEERGIIESIVLSSKDFGKRKTLIPIENPTQILPNSWGLFYICSYKDSQIYLFVAPNYKLKVEQKRVLTSGFPLIRHIIKISAAHKAKLARVGVRGLKEPNFRLLLGKDKIRPYPIKIRELEPYANRIIAICDTSKDMERHLPHLKKWLNSWLENFSDSPFFGTIYSFDDRMSLLCPFIPNITLLRDTVEDIKCSTASHSLFALWTALNKACESLLPYFTSTKAIILFIPPLDLNKTPSLCDWLYYFCTVNDVVLIIVEFSHQENEFFRSLVEISNGAYFNAYKTNITSAYSKLKKLLKSRFSGWYTMAYNYPKNLKIPHEEWEKVELTVGFRGLYTTECFGYYLP